MDQFKTISLPPLSQTTSRLPSECLSFFAFPDPALRNDAIMQLKASLQHTVKQWPFLCGTVVPIYGTPLGTDAELPKQHNMITLRYLPSLPDDIQEAGLLEVMEVSKEQFPYSYADLCQAGVPQSYLQDDIFKPMVVDGTPETHIPVYRARIIFVDGGLIIANFVHHAVFSGYERAQIVQRWAENCRRLGKGEVMCDLEKNDDAVSHDTWSSITPPQTQDWNAALKVCPDWTACKEAEDPLLYRSSGTQRTFTFSAASLELLKTSIKGQLAEAKIATFLNAEGEQLLNASEKLPLAHSPLSTFKCLAALLWHHVTRARLPRLQDLERSIMVQVAVGLKARGLVPQSAFPGFSVVNPTAYLSIGEVTSSAPGTLAKLAHFVRDTIDHVDDDYLSKVLQLITSIPDVTKICTTGEVERCDAGFLVNSWARFLGDTKWDVVGTSSSVPEWGRKASGPIEGYALVMPRRNDKDADWEVLLGLREEDMECLLADDTFLGWVKRVVQ